MNYWTDTRTVELDGYQIERLLLLLTEYRMDVESGDVSGYGQDKADELGDVNELLDVLNRAQG